MKYFAQIAHDGEVMQVVTVNDDVASTEQDGIDFLHNLYGSNFDWAQTFKDGRRYNFAAKGFRYNRQEQAFYAPRPSDDYVLSTESYQWYVPDCVSITSDKDPVIGDGVDEVLVTVRGALGATYDLTIAVGGMVTTETVTLDNEITPEVGTDEFVLVCDTFGETIEISYDDVSKTLVVIYG